MKESFSIKFYLRITDDKKNEGKIYIRITVNRKKAEIATEHTIGVEDWDEQRQRAKKNPALNEELAFIENKLLEIKRQLKYQNKPITSKIVKNIYVGAANPHRYVVDYFLEYIKYMESMPTEFSKHQLTQHRCACRHLLEFIKTKGVNDVLIAEVDYKFIKDFDNYLLTKENKQYKKPMIRNSANKQHQKFKTVLRNAVKEKLISENPYVDFSLKNEKTSRDFLNERELQLLQDHPLSDNHSLQKVRDIFLFSVYTGLRFSDALSLKVGNVWSDNSGKWWFNLKQEKTNEFLGTPLLKPAIEIINKYDDEERKITGYILPRFSNQKTNAYLKTIADLVGIDKQLTHHVARHTFATTITLSNNVPIEVVSKMLGHTNIRTTQIYAKITNQYLSEHTSKLDEILAGNSVSK